MLSRVTTLRGTLRAGPATVSTAFADAAVGTEHTSHRPRWLRRAGTSWPTSCAAAASASRPEQVGLPSGGRRRTPGLRREEVALLAGLGVTWYTWLEQGRDIRVSAQVLEAVARTLQLDRHERSHLFTLADLPLAPDAPRVQRRDTGAAAAARPARPVPGLRRSPRATTCWPTTRPTWRSPATSTRCRSRSATTCGWRSPAPIDVPLLVDWEEAVRRMVGSLPQRDGRPRRRAGVDATWSIGSSRSRPSSASCGTATTSRPREPHQADAAPAGRSADLHLQQPLAGSALGRPAA